MTDNTGPSDEQNPPSGDASMPDAPAVPSEDHADAESAHNDSVTHDPSHDTTILPTGSDGQTHAYPAPTDADYANYQQAAAQPYGQAPYAQTGAPTYDQTYAQPGYQPASPVPGMTATETGAWDSAGQQPEEQRSNKTVNKAIIAGVVAGLVAGLLAGVAGVAIGSAVSGSPYSTGTQYNPANPDALSPRADNSVAAIAKKVLPSTVTIIAKSGREGGTGSGFVYNSDGYILTNNHVISAAAAGGEIAVQFPNQSPVPAKLVGRSVSYDIAVIKIDQGSLPAATLGNSDSVVIGDGAIAVGSPLGLEGTVTNGIISALRRPVTAGGQGESSFISALQTDAPINPGNSGGPLVNTEGQVIGVNSAIASLGASDGGQSGSIGLGFAIPINNAKRIADEIISTGKSTVPIIGVQPNTEYDGTGAQVGKVEPGSPAAQAGLKDGDVITAVNGNKIAGPGELLSAIRANQPGQDITLTVTGPNGGASRDVTVKLGSRTE
ncbi:MAG: trypsin-like peptidase domain-containing protein [Candidatus Nanopelagicales bacterium]